MEGGGSERDREGKREKERERLTQRERQREREKQRQRQRGTQRQREKRRQTDRQMRQRERPSGLLGTGSSGRPPRLSPELCRPATGGGEVAVGRWRRGAVARRGLSPDDLGT